MYGAAVNTSGGLKRIEDIDSLKLIASLTVSGTSGTVSLPDIDMQAMLIWPVSLAVPVMNVDASAKTLTWQYIDAQISQSTFLVMTR